MTQDTRIAFLDRTVEKLLYVIEKLVVVLIFIVFVATMLQVIFRYLFNYPLLWTEEVARYVGIWFIMLSNARAIKDRTHACVDIVTSKMSQRVQKGLNIFNDIITLFVMSYLSYYILNMISRFFSTPSPAMRIPMGVVYIGYFIGCILSAVAAVFVLLMDIVKLKSNSQTQKEGETA